MPDHNMPPVDDAPQPRHSRLCIALTFVGLMGVALWGFATIFAPAAPADDANDATVELPATDNPAMDDGSFTDMDDANFAMPDMPAAPVPAQPDSTAADTLAEPLATPTDTSVVSPALPADSVPESTPLPADTLDM